ncbi:MAG: 5-carboxymethyl-2-hydroxymuconate Delta-isomerase [Rhizobiales bacterium]|nr:5-carboxymethyl-2-hydroxymuconate Delta-isomerase [Hyphomicrobiales bacterium]NRB14381.1 5-carboxymethyl-2-hydroxymuconate Delta-isomerase [Hyphomicrobiales bacterium]
MIEYSKNLQKIVEPSNLISAVHQAAIGSDLFDTNDIRTRAMVFEDFQIRADKHHFIHVTLRIMTGRTNAQKTQLSQKVLAALKTFNFSSIILSVEIRDIDQPTYAKETL